MVSYSRVKSVAQSLRYGGINARSSSKDNSIKVKGKKGYDIAKKDRLVLFNDIKINRYEGEDLDLL
jgi:hypothetical protein